MSLISKILLFGIVVFKLTAEDEMNINFKDLQIMDLVKITSKIIDKNILITEEIKGNVDFVSNKPINKDELIKILGFVLEDKGYSLIQSDEMLRIINNMTSGTNKDTVIVELTNIDATDAKKNLDAIAKSKFNDKVETQKVSIIDNKDNNSLVIIGEKSNINYLARYIENVDSNSSLIKKEVKVFSLKNVDAINVIKILDSIVGKKIYTDPNSKPLVSADEESNAIVVMGPADEVENISKLVKN
jgi:general secretion pathway protein D